MTSQDKTRQDKIQWLAVLQGWSMLLVVIGHAALDSGASGLNSSIAAGIQSVIYSFHMQLFMFISGWLFFYTCINRNKAYKSVMRSKLSRLGIPFIVFTLATTCIKLLMSAYVDRPVDTTELINTFIFFKSNPLLEMWFVVALIVLMAMYPAYKYLLKSKSKVILGVVIMLTLFLLFPIIENYFQLKRVAQMGLFFYTGLLACKYDWVSFVKHRLVFIISLIIFVSLQFLPLSISSPIGLITSFAGITLSASLCMNIADRLPNLFYSFRDYTYQIFLFGIFFQIACKIVYRQLNIEILYWAMYVLNICFAIYLPVVISKVVLKINNTILKKSIGL